jgi:hypothetical protein
MKLAINQATFNIITIYVEKSEFKHRKSPAADFAKLDLSNI